MYRPTEVRDMRVPFKLFVVSEYEKVKGVMQPKSYAEKDLIYCSFKTYGGTEKDVNGRYVIYDTANIITWFRPDIKSDCRLKRMSDGALFEILNEPENIEMKNQYLKFKVQRIKGKM